MPDGFRPPGAPSSDPATACKVEKKKRVYSPRNAAGGQLPPRNHCIICSELCHHANAYNPHSLIWQAILIIQRFWNMTTLPTTVSKIPPTTRGLHTNPSKMVEAQSAITGKSTVA